MARIKALVCLGGLAALSLLGLLSGALWRERLRYRRLAAARTAGEPPPAAESVPELRFQDRDLEHQAAAKYD